MRRLVMLSLTTVTLACGGSTSDGLSSDKDGGGAGGAAGTGTGGSSNGGTGNVATGGAGSGGVGNGGAGGIATGGVGNAGAGGIATGGVGNGGAGGIATGGVGNGGSGGGTGGNPTFCSSLCQKIAGAQCPNEEPYNACFAGCQVDMPAYQSQCGAETSSFMGCALGPGTIACDQDGESKVTGCNNQLVSWIQCAGCIPSTGDDACDACSKSSCCSQLNAVYDHPQFAPYLACVYACTTESCAQNCYVQHAALQPSVTALAQCQGSSCPAC